MSKKIVLRKATRIEGNAHVHIEIENGRVLAARFLVEDFRGFETFLQGRRVEFIPHLVSRICGLCSASHQLAGIQAIEDALSVEVPPTVEALREIILLGEWISSHAFSYFFLTMPDLLSTKGDVFKLMSSHPLISGEAMALRRAGLQIVEILAKRSAHPVAMGVGHCPIPPTDDDMEKLFRTANDVKDRTARLVAKLAEMNLRQKTISAPPDLDLNCLIYNRNSGSRGPVFQVFDRSGGVKVEFPKADFEDHVSEMRADWTFAKFPYLTHLGFPEGIVLVGPLSRTFRKNGPLYDNELADLPLVQQLRRRDILNLESIDACRLLEIFWAAKRILDLITEVDLAQTGGPVDLKGSGKGIGVVEAPRGVLVHSYLIRRGCLDRMRLLVATQFNNPFMNFLLRDLAERHVVGDSLSREGEQLIGRCLRVFDPCLSCATH